MGHINYFFLLIQVGSILRACWFGMGTTITRMGLQKLPLPNGIPSFCVRWRA